MTAAPRPPGDIAQVFLTYPETARQCLMDLRRHIFDVAATTNGVGTLTEELKWGQPAYLTKETQSGTTIRLGYKAAMPRHAFFYVHCQTTLLESYRAMFPDAFLYEGNRAVGINLTDELTETPVDLCLQMALTYHLSKRGR